MKINYNVAINPEMKGQNNIEDAIARRNEDGLFSVSIVFTNQGSQKFAKVTSRYAPKKFRGTR